MPDNAWYYFMWWQLIILLGWGGAGWQRLSAGGMNIATGPELEQRASGEDIKCRGCTSLLLLHIRQAPAQKAKRSHL